MFSLTLVNKSFLNINNKKFATMGFITWILFGLIAGAIAK
jgi:hypothetical protein